MGALLSIAAVIYIAPFNLEEKEYCLKVDFTHSSDECICVETITIHENDFVKDGV